MQKIEQQHRDAAATMRTDIEVLIETLSRKMWDEGDDQLGSWDENQEPIENGRSMADIYRDHARILIPEFQAYGDKRHNAAIEQCVLLLTLSVEHIANPNVSRLSNIIKLLRMDDDESS